MKITFHNSFLSFLSHLYLHNQFHIALLVFGNGLHLNLTDISKVLNGVRYSFSGTKPVRFRNGNLSKSDLPPLLGGYIMLKVSHFTPELCSSKKDFKILSEIELRKS